MQILIGILLLFFPPNPMTLAPTDHGLFPDFGFSQSDSEKFVPILNLFQSGAYIVEEVDSGKFLNDTSIYNFSIKGDSLITEERRIHGGAFSKSTLREVYSRKGKLLYRAIISEGRISNICYFVDNGNWVSYKHIRPMKYNNWTDTVILDEKIIYDKHGRPLEQDDFDEFEEFIDYGKIAFKTIYTYRSNEVEELQYKRKLIERPMASKQQLKDSIGQAKYAKDLADFKKMKLFGPVEYIAFSREFKRVDSVVRSIETERYNYSDGDTTFFDWSDETTFFDKNWHPIREIKQSKYRGSVRATIDTFEYSKNPEGNLLQRISSREGEPPMRSDSWQFDKKGHCILHAYGKNNETWTYDPKGNIIEFNSGWYKNTFKIFYK
jgi:hypothetical protein